MRIAVVGSAPGSLVSFRGPMIRAFRSAGHEVLACAPNLNGDVQETLSSWGVETENIRLQRQGLNPYSDLRAFWDLYHLFRRWQPDQVLSYTAKPVVYGSLAARAAGARPVAMMTGLGINYSVDTGRARWVRAVMNRLYRAAFGACDTVIFQNQDNVELLREMSVLGDTKEIYLINGSGVEIDYFAQAPLPDRPVFLCLARLIAEKGIREYVAAARAIKSDHPDAVFQLAGWPKPGVPGGITRSELEEWTDEGVIEYLGALKDVRPAIRNAAIYVLPSYYREGIPRSILEALSMGRPVITTRSSGCRETVRDGVNGYLVEPRSSEALAEACQRMINHPERWAGMGQRSREIAVHRFDVRKVNRTIIHVMGLRSKEYVFG